MSDTKWKVNDGTQVVYDDKLHNAGDMFTASAEQIEAQGLAPYVTKVGDKAENKAMAAPKPRTSDKS